MFKRFGLGLRIQPAWQVEVQSNVLCLLHEPRCFGFVALRWREDWLFVPHLVLEKGRLIDQFRRPECKKVEDSCTGWPR